MNTERARKAFHDLVAAEKTATDNVKARARAVLIIDEETAGTRLKDVQEALKKRGVNLTDNRASRARYIGRLLKALDKTNLDPVELKEIHDETLLYELQATHEKTGTKHHDLLEQIKDIPDPESAATLLKNLRRPVQGASVEAKWVAPFRGKTCPPETANKIDEGFKAFRGTDTVLMGLERWAEICDTFTPDDWQFIEAWAQSDMRRHFIRFCQVFARENQLELSESVSRMITTFVGVVDGY